ncbi:MAG: putative ATP-binding protein involved in virulence [Phenylobacterium sp.]|jgi:predicted ATP-binding protein involved in virulence
MKIDEITLFNFRSAAEVQFAFNPQLNLFVGVNGSGKSTILDALSIALSWLVKRIERENGRGDYIAQSNLRNNHSEGSLEVHLTEKEQVYHWFLPKLAKGSQSNFKIQLNGVNQLAQIIKTHYESDKTLPVIAYYSVNRLVATTKPNIPTQHSISDFDVYANALGGKTNYQSFFEWFRLQDDILNENAQSRTKWMQQNENWTKRRVKLLLGDLRDTLPDRFNPIKIHPLIQKIEANKVIYNEPRFLFLELSDLIETFGLSIAEYLPYVSILQSVVFMFHKMSALAEEQKDDLIDESQGVKALVQKVIDNFAVIDKQGNGDIKLHRFCWGAFNLGTLLSLWWLSDKGKKALESEFKRNSQQITTDLPLFIQQIIEKDIQQKNNAHSNEGQELSIVTQAIEQFIPEYRFLRVKRVPRPHMLIEKNGETYNLDQLSDGEKNLIALVGDIARRLAIGNPRSDNPLKGEGFILIDEIDLHLHPSWQRLVIPKLLEVFPGCQFFISTHSPQIISHVKPESIFLLKQTEGCLDYVKAIESYGKNTDRILEDLLGVSARPAQEKEKLHQLFTLIQSGELAQAVELVNDLSALIGDDADLVKANVLIKRKELIGK